MKIAIIGTGISGLVAAHHLQGSHDLDLFEANDYVGGHTNTIDVDLGGASLPIDTGFIVFNDWTYPNFISLLSELGVRYSPTSMGFSVRSDRDRLEYSGGSLDALFAQRRNLLRPSHYAMLIDILRFNRTAIKDCDSDDPDQSISLSEYLVAGGYGKNFINHYIIPMGAAIWSTDPQRMLDFPASTFIRFFKNHGLLNLSERPTWYVVDGGSKAYVEKLIEPFQSHIHLSTPVAKIKRRNNEVLLTLRSGESLRYDRVIIATHSDQALTLLADASASEQQLLGAIRYQPNEAVLHTDTALLPRRRRAWAAWNYRIPAAGGDAVSLTYNMNILQNLTEPRTYCVTLNDTSSVRPESVIQRIQYSHPVFDTEAIAAQQSWHCINGVNNTYYCGAYWGYGFHEDGVNSALRVVRALREDSGYEELHLRRVG